MEDEVRDFKRRKFQDLEQKRAHKGDSPAAKEAWVKAVKDIKDIDTAIRNGANTLAEVKTAIIQNASLVAEINKELGIAEEIVVAEEAVVETEQTSDGGVFSARLEALISAALQDGVLTEQEKAILKKRVEKEGEDWDEVEMIINARLTEMQPALQPKNNVERNAVCEKDEDVTPSIPSMESNTKIVPEGVAELSPISEQQPKCSEDSQTTDDGLEKQLESQYLIVNGTVYKEFSESKINEDIISKVSGLNIADIISVTIPTCVKKIDKKAFNWSRHLEEITIPSSVTTIGEDAFGIIPSDGSLKKVLLNCPIISSSLFSGAPLEEVILGDCVNKIENRAFANCENLTSVTIPCNVIEIGNDAFCCCANLKKVNLDKCDKLESIGSYAFGDCKKLTELDFSNCVSLKHCGGDALEYCENIRIIDFSNCESLDLPWFSIKRNTKLVLPPGQQTLNELFLLEQYGYNIDTSKCKNVKVLYNGAFRGMDIKEIVIPDTVEIIGEYKEDYGPFYQCKNLKTIVMPALLKEIKASLGEDMDQLKKIDFSKVKNLKSIPKKFVGNHCPKLKELIIPQGVKEIEDDAFALLFWLKCLFLPPTLESIGDLGHTTLSIYCFSPSLEELEPMVYGWDDKVDEEWGEKPMKINLFVLPQYLNKYIAQRKAERIPEDVLIIQEIPEEYRYYYDN